MNTSINLQPLMQTEGLVRESEAFESMDELKMRVRKLMVQPTSAALSADAHGFLKTLLVLDPAARATGAALLRLKWLGGDGGPAPSPRRPILE